MTHTHVDLKPIERSNWRACVLLEVSEDQRSFVAPNATSLAQAFGEQEQRPHAIYAGKEMVGFLMYRFLDGEGAFYLQRLMVDRRFQRRGLARAALQTLMASLAEDGRATKLLLSVVAENLSAIRLYQSVGFARTGRLEGGEVEMVRSLARA